MNIMHLSDTHSLSVLNANCYALDLPDVYVLSGDMMKNHGVVSVVGDDGRPYYRRVPSVEAEFQKEEQEEWVEDLRYTFAHRPVVIVRGNHDFADYSILKEAGLNIFELTPEKPVCEIQGVRFAGFHEVDWINGTWFGESKDYRKRIDEVLYLRPQILVTHTPPYGVFHFADVVLKKGQSSDYLYEKLMHHPTIKLHMFGHIHEDGGEVAYKYGKVFQNAANIWCITTRFYDNEVQEVSPLLYPSQKSPR